MSAFVVSSLIIAIGVLSVGIGILLARDMLHEARRMHRRIVSQATDVLEDWDAWFLDGFSRMAMGCRWLWAMVICAGWSAIGVGCIGLGFRVLSR